MTLRNISPDRREFLKRSAAFSGAALVATSVVAKDASSEIALRFQVAAKGKKFGVKIIRLKNGTNMISLRDLAGKQRYAYTFNFDSLPPTNTVSLKRDDKIYQLSRKGDWLTTNFPGVAIGYPEAPARSAEGEEKQEETVPPELQEGTRGFLSWLKGVASSVWNGVKGAAQAVGIAIAIVTVLVFGGDTQVNFGENSWIYVSKKDNGDFKITTGTYGNRFMPPPPGTPLDPTVWY